MDLTVTVHTTVLTGTSLLMLDLTDIGIQTPMIQMNQGNTRSATYSPFHVACSMNQ